MRFHWIFSSIWKWLRAERRRQAVAGGLALGAVAAGLGVGVYFAVAGGGGGEPEPSPAVIRTASPSPRATASPRPTAAPTPTPAPAFPPIVDAQEVFVVDADGGDPALIHATAGVSDLAWSPDGRKIAFAAGSGATSIYVAEPPDAAGDPLVEIQGRVTRLLWAADGRRIAYHIFHSVSGTGSVTSISVLDTDSGASRQLVEGGEDLGLVAWFPGGSELLVVQAGQLLRVDSSSGSQSMIAEGFLGLTSERASLAPDGSRVAVGAEKSCTLRLVNVTDGSSNDVVSGSCSMYYIVWSRDGTEIAYSIREGERGTYVLNLASGQTRRLTIRSGVEVDVPRWLPDGSGLAILRCYEGCGGAVFVPVAGGCRAASGDSPASLRHVRWVRGR